ncbi:unnamed protein product [Alopecurus aequalis]
MGNKPTSSADKQFSSVDRHHMSETSSRCFAECITATHNFEVIRYSQLDGMGIGKAVCLSTFSVSGYGWNIRMFPDGWAEHNAGYMSVSLRFCSGTTDVKVKCVLTVVKKPRTEDGSTVIQLPQSDLHKHFANMLKDGEGADVTFSVGDQLFSAHRCVLAARSPVFKAELFGQMKEITMNCIKIDDMEPAIFEALLHFIYTESLPRNSELDQNAALQHMLVAADRYGMDRLKAICEGNLCHRINVQTVATTLALAEQHHSVLLKNACLGYLSSQEVFRVVKETKGFKHLAASCPSIMMDILERLTPPSGVFAVWLRTQFEILCSSRTLSIFIICLDCPLLD